MEKNPEKQRMLMSVRNYISRFVTDRNPAGERLNRLEIIQENIFQNSRGNYDRIIATAGVSPDSVSRIKILVDRLLKENGIVVCPYQRGPMMVLRKKDGQMTTQFTQEQYAFVPLIV